MSEIVTYTIDVHHDPEYGYEAAVKELPGCFAAGDTLDELQQSLVETIGLYLSDDERTVTVRPTDNVEESLEVELCSA